MAKYRPPEYCLQCGKQLTPIYRDQSNLPLMQRIIGDTFMGYKPCECSVKLPIKTEGEDEKTSTLNFYDTIPNSHYWVSLETLLNWAKHQPHSDSMDELMIGLRNTINHGYALTESPSHIDVESLAKQKAKEKYPGEMNMMGYKVNAQKNNQEKFIEGFKAGYAVKSASYKSNKSIIEWTDFLGDMGWYKVKETGRWEHDDEQGYFESAEDLVNHYLKESTPQSSTGGLPKLDEPILNDDDVKGIIESSTEEEEKLWDELIKDVDDGCLQSQLQEKYKISKR